MMWTYEKSLMAGIPQFVRGKVWCTVCGRAQKVNCGDAMRSGWPKCCGYTMTLDSPLERAAFDAKREGKR